MCATLLKHLPKIFVCLPKTFFTMNLHDYICNFPTRNLFAVLGQRFYLMYCQDPLVSNVFHSDIFFEINDVVSFADEISAETSNPAGIYLLKVNNRNTRTRCEICSKLTINTPERRHWRRSGVFIVNFEHISHLFLVFLLLTLSK